MILPPLICRYVGQYSSPTTIYWKGSVKLCLVCNAFRLFCHIQHFILGFLWTLRWFFQNLCTLRFTLWLKAFLCSMAFEKFSVMYRFYSIIPDIFTSLKRLSLLRIVNLSSTTLGPLATTGLFSDVQFYITSSLHCIVHSPPQVKSPSITLCPFLPSSTSFHNPLPWKSPHCCSCPWVFSFLLNPSTRPRIQLPPSAVSLLSTWVCHHVAC